MSTKIARFPSDAIQSLTLTCFVLAGFSCWGQTSNVGIVSVTVLDPAGASVPGASLELKDRETNEVRRAATQTSGAF